MGRRTALARSSVSLAWQEEADVSPGHWHTEYEAEFTNQLGLDASVHEPLHQASPRWPTSFKKNYVHIEDYRRLECEIENVKAQRDLLAAALAEAEREIATWKSSHKQVEERMHKKDLAIGKGLKHVQASLAHFTEPPGQDEHEAPCTPNHTISTVRTTVMAHTHKSSSPQPDPADLNRKAKLSTKACYMRTAQRASSPHAGEDITLVYGGSTARKATSVPSPVKCVSPYTGPGGVVSRYALEECSARSASVTSEQLELDQRVAHPNSRPGSGQLKGAHAGKLATNRKPKVPRQHAMEEIESYPAELPMRYHGHGSWIP